MIAQTRASCLSVTISLAITNLDNLNRDRVRDPDGTEPKPITASWQVKKYIKVDAFLTVIGVYQVHNDHSCFQARTVLLPHFELGRYLFEDTHWWIDQISDMADKWLDDLFDSTRSYKIDDFSELYRTNLNITGGPTDNMMQECATLSRLIYGLSSTYLLTGEDRYLLAAKAGVSYQRQAFRSLSHDGKHCFWAFGRRPGVDGSKLVVASENEDDKNTIPLYEQIYALAGLVQYYRITQEWQVLEDIRRTIDAFQEFYHDDEKSRSKGFPGQGGYFSHIDYATMRPDSSGLNDNKSRKNWNSIGDHIPAYLVNLLLALDHVPTDSNRPNLEKFRNLCLQILTETSKLIVAKFPDSESKYVNERFDAYWIPDHSWRWQGNRAIIGHNLKIAWNLTRVYFYYQTLSANGQNESSAYIDHAKQCLELAKRLAKDMGEAGLDMIRGGVFDAVERKPSNNMPIEFSWMPTKDFWQQEQGILAYLILHGADPENILWLELARESAMFWNAFFLDRDRRGIFFRTRENGHPIIQGFYGNKGGHSISGYHAFELNYLAHLYTRSFVATAAGDNNFCLYFKIEADCEQESINVLPDFFPPKRLKIERVCVNGIDREDLKPESTDDFQIPLKAELRSTKIELAVEFVSVVNNEARREGDGHD